MRYPIILLIALLLLFAGLSHCERDLENMCESYAMTANGLKQAEARRACARL